MQNTLGPILIADDDADYALLIQLALNEAGIFHPVVVVHDGLHVIDFLKAEGEYADRAGQPPPSLISLDLRLPVRHGFEVLRWIRSHHEFDSTHVVIFSGSGFEAEERTARELGATRFLVKPHEFRHLIEALKQVWHARVQSDRGVEAGTVN